MQRSGFVASCSSSLIPPLACAAIAWLSLASSAAYAVEADEATSASSGDSAEEDVLERLIEMDLEDLYQLEVMTVTARKREEGIQRVPVAITAIGGVELEQAGITDIKNLTSYVPSLQMNSSNTETTGSTVRLRGVGTTGNNAGLEGSVGVFLDGTFLSRPGIAFTDLVDIEQIEVLRGPQGTLHGRNTSAGAIDIKTRRPNMNAFESRLDYTYANYSDDVFTGVINLPVVEDTVALRFSGGYHHGRGFLVSDFDDNIRSNDRERFLVRGQLQAAPIDSLTVRIVGDYFEANEKCCDALIRHESSTIPDAFDAFGGSFADNGVTSNFGSGALDDRTTNANRERENDQDQWGVMVETLWATPVGEFTYLGSYREWNTTQSGDDDFTTNDILFTQPSPTDIELTTHEVRLHGDGDALDWMVGASMSYERIRATGHLGLGANYEEYVDLLAGGPGTTAFLNGLAPGASSPVDSNGNPEVIGDQRFAQDGTAWGIYTHNVVDLGELFSLTTSDVLELTGGLRYNWERKEGSFENGTSNPGCENLIARSRVGAGLDTPGADALAGVLCFPFVSTGAPEWDQDFEDDQLTGTVALSVDVAEWMYLFDSALVYASYSRGFKSGGFNLDSTAAIVNPLSSATIPDDPVDDAAPGNYLEEGDASFDSETIDSYEVGFKTDFLDSRVRANLTWFHYDIDDFQLLEFNGIQFRTDNVKTVTVDGVELDLVARPFHGLDLYTSVIYTHARYGSKGCDYDREATNFEDLVCGRPLTNAPEWVVNLGGKYGTTLFHTSYTGDVQGSLSLNYQWKDERRAGTRGATTAEQSNARIQPDSFSLDLRATLEPEDYRWAIELWGRNITDERTSSALFAVPLRSGATGAFIDEPRTFGVTFRATL